MNYKFYYTNTKTFDDSLPSQPKGAITTYYRSIKQEHDDLLEFVSMYLNGMKLDLESDPSTANVYGKEIKPHKKKTGSYYTAADIITDLWSQLQKKDPTESMINRWNSLFSEIDVPDGCISTVQGTRPLAPKLPNSLFEETK